MLQINKLDTLKLGEIQQI